MAITQSSAGDRSGQQGFAKRLAEAGYSNFYIIDRETANKVLTEKRIELLDTVRDQDIRSIRQLARTLERDIKSVYSDLQLLFREGLVEFEKEGNRKIPVIPYEHIFIQPIF